MDDDDDRIGVRVPRFGIFQHSDTVAMARWHTGMEYLSDTEVAINWAVNTSAKRISIPQGLEDGISSDPTERESAIKRMLLKGGRKTPFGSVPYRALLMFREDKWLDDSCMGHGIALLQREHINVGSINPLISRLANPDDQRRTTNAGNPFQETNKIFLLPLYVDNSHWCGAVIDYRRESRGILLFDPCKSPNRNTMPSAKHN
ncbi:hypothetical protein GQ600_14691 [Phytophthora cactorum]|nr:hypothetical protein GQ600_14691 [Phytophthora cactorum]